MNVTGQIFFRRASSHRADTPPDGSDRDMVMFVGVIATPHELWLPEHQYTIGGNQVPGVGTSLMVFEEGAIDKTEEMRGNTLGHAVLLPIWRV